MVAREINAHTWLIRYFPPIDSVVIFTKIFIQPNQMKNRSTYQNEIRSVNNFHDLVSIPFSGTENAFCWKRDLKGNFSELADKLELKENVTVVEQKNLLSLNLTEEGKKARETILCDFELLKVQGASPTLNLIRNYDRDDVLPFFPTDVYSFHVDRSPIPTNTFLCTYVGEPSEILPNSQAEQKILVPEIRRQLEKLYGGTGEEFELFLKEHFFDLHYQAKPGANLINLGIGNLWRLAVDHPDSLALPCIHRAPEEMKGQRRLLMIC